MSKFVKKIFGNPVLWLGLAVFTLYGKILFGEILFQKDVFAYQLPEKFLIRNCLSSGEIPQLNPYVACGSSFLGNIDAGVLNPLNFLLLCGDFIFGFHLFVFVHLLLAGLAMYFLLRRAFNLDSWVSALGGLSYTFGYVWSSVSFGSYRCAYLVPLFFLFYLRFLNSGDEGGKEKMSDIFFSSLCLGLLLLCGNFQEAYAGILFAVIFLISRLVADLRRGISLGQGRLLGAAVIIFSGILLSAPAILPAYLCSIESYRSSGISLLESQQWSFPPQRIAEYFSPFLFGARQGDGLWYSGIYTIEETFSKTGLTPWADCVFIGLPMIAGFLLFFRAKDCRFRKILLLCLCLSLLAALGKYTFLYSSIYFAIPGFKMFRHPEKFVFWVHFFLIVSGALGLDALRREDKLAASMKKILSGFLAISTVVVIVAVFVFLATPEAFTRFFQARGCSWNGERIFIWEISSVLTLVFSASAMLLFCKFITGRFSLFIILCTATAFATFFFWSQRTRWTIPKEMLAQTENWAQVTPDFDKAAYRVFNAAKKFRAGEIVKIAEGDDHLAIKLAEFATLDCNAPALYGFKTLTGFSPVISKKYSAYMNFGKNPPERILDLLSVRFIAVNVEPGVKIPEGSRVIYEDGEDNFKLIENTDAIPRVKAFSSAQIWAGEEKLFSDTAKNILFVSEIPENCLKFKALPTSKIQAYIISEAPSGGMSIKVSNGPGWICVRDWFLNGWRCYDSSGVRMKIVKADGGLMAVYSERENDIITFKFHPPGLVAGIILSALGLILSVGYCTFRFSDPQLK